MKVLKWMSGSFLGMTLAMTAPVEKAAASESTEFNEVDVVERALPAEVEAEVEARDSRTAVESLKMWQARLKAYRRMGGPAHKAGLVRRAEYEVARYQREVKLESGVVTTPAPSPAAAVPHEQRAKRYRQMGGMGYKTGLVQRADAEARRNGSQIGVTESNIVVSNTPPSSGKTVEILRRGARN